MKKFAVPYNYDYTLLEHLFEEMQPFVKEVYFPADLRVHSNGRSDPQPENYSKQILKIIEYSTQNNVKSNLILNGLCTGLQYTEREEVRKLLQYVDFLLQHGLQCVTVSNPLLARAIHQEFVGKPLEISVSVNSCIGSVQKAVYWEEIGATSFTLDCDFNKDLTLLANLKKHCQMKIKVIVNQTCIPDCFVRTTHNLLVSHAGEREGVSNIDRDCFRICMTMNHKKPWLVYSSPLIPPYALTKYDPFVDTYKISGRNRPTQEILNIVGAYAQLPEYREYTQYYNAMIPQDILERIFTCSRVCRACNYCQDQYKALFMRNLVGYRNGEQVDPYLLQKSRPLVYPDEIRVKS